LADINQVISLGIGSPAGIPEFLTFGLQLGAAGKSAFVIHYLDSTSELLIIDTVTYSHIYLDTSPKLPEGVY